MTDQELLQAMGQMLDAKISPLQEDIRTIRDAQVQLEARMGRHEERMDKLEVQTNQLEKRMEKVEAKVDGIRVLLDTDIRRTLNLIMENQQILTERMPDPRVNQRLETRVAALEMAVRQHSWEIQELKRA